MLSDGLREAYGLLVSRDPLVLDAAWRSLWISCLAVAIASFLGVLAGSVLARTHFWGRQVLTLLARLGMAIPTVLIGLLCYGLLSRRGILGGIHLLYTPWAIVAGEVVLAVPIVTTWTHRAVSSIDPRVPETARTLGAGLTRRWLTYVSECRSAIMLAVLTAYARCFTELGIAVMVGGNIKYRTRTLTTATALETARGEFGRGVAMSFILLLIALAVTLIVFWFEMHQSRSRP